MTDHPARNLAAAVAATVAILAAARVLGAMAAGHATSLWRRRHFHHPRHERRPRR